MLGVPQLFEDRWQQGGGSTTPPAAPVKRGRGRPRKHPLPQDKGGGGVTPRRPAKGSRRVHTDDEWSDWNESSYDTWQPEWTPQQPEAGTALNGPGGGPPSAGGPIYSPGAQTPSMVSCQSQFDRTPTTPSSPPTGPASLIGVDMSSMPPTSVTDPSSSPTTANDWKDDYCYSMTYDVNYILATTSPENTQMIPRLPPTTDQSGNMLVHWHANPSLPSRSAEALYAMTGYEGVDSPTGLPCAATNG